MPAPKLPLLTRVDDWMDLAGLVFIRDAAEDARHRFARRPGATLELHPGEQN